MRGFDRPTDYDAYSGEQGGAGARQRPIRLIKEPADVGPKELSPLFEQMYSDLAAYPAGANSTPYVNRSASLHRVTGFG